MSCNVKDIAQYVVNYFIRCKKPVTNLKLQKILYFLWIDYFKDNGEYLFNENFEAWVLGPVVPQAYYEFSAYGADIILRFKDVQLNLDEVKIKILNKILDKYANYSAYELVDMSHKKGGAWAEVYRNGEGRWDTIEFEVIKKLECI